MAHTCPWHTLGGASVLLQRLRARMQDGEWRHAGMRAMHCRDAQYARRDVPRARRFYRAPLPPSLCTCPIAACPMPVSCSAQPLLLASSMGGSTHVLHGASGALLASSQPHAKYTVRALWSPDGAFIASGSHDQSLVLQRVLQLQPAGSAAAEQHSSGASGGGGGGVSVELVKQVTWQLTAAARMPSLHVGRGSVLCACMGICTACACLYRRRHQKKAWLHALRGQLHRRCMAVNAMWA